MHQGTFEDVTVFLPRVPLCVAERT